MKKPFGGVWRPSWESVVQIDVARIPGPVFEHFCIILRLENGSVFEICDLDEGFKSFQVEFLEEWPWLESALTKIYCGPPDIEERATLWKRQVSY